MKNIGPSPFSAVFGQYPGWLLFEWTPCSACFEMSVSQVPEFDLKPSARSRVWWFSQPYGCYFLSVHVGSSMGTQGNGDLNPQVVPVPPALCPQQQRSQVLHHSAQRWNRITWMLLNADSNVFIKKWERKAFSPISKISVTGSDLGQGFAAQKMGWESVSRILGLNF